MGNKEAELFLCWCEAEAIIWLLRMRLWWRLSLELQVVVTIDGILATLEVPSRQHLKHRQQAQCDSLQRLSTKKIKKQKAKKVTQQMVTTGTFLYINSIMSGV